MSATNFTRKVRLMGGALAHIETEGRAIIQRVTRRQSAKIISLRTGITPRHVYNLRDGECDPRWKHFIALALEYPELRAAIARWLAFEHETPASPEAMLAQIRRIVVTLPEEGDSET